MHQADEGDDHKAARHRYGREPAEDLDLRARQGDLLLGLAQGGVEEVTITRLGLAAGERELSSVGPEVSGALDQQEARAELEIGGEQRGEHGGEAQRARVGQRIVDGVEPAA